MISALALADLNALAPYLAGAFLGGYLLGSIPFGLIFTYAAGGGDVRKIGSGNIGATNVLRTGKKWAAAATLLCDGLKGVIAVYLAYEVGGTMLQIFAAFGAFVGHVFPVWLKFKGGKGVATFIGIALALFWPAGVLTCISWLLTARISRLSSFAALVSAAFTPAFFILFDYWLYALVMLVLASILFATHRANIGRLLQGSEPRIGAK